MDPIKWNYFQYRKQYDYPVYIRFKQEDLNPKFIHLLTEIGFVDLNEKESKKISLSRPLTKILTIQAASPRLQQQINGPDHMDKYGQEALSIQGGLPIYTYRKVGVMGLPPGKIMWELAIHPDIAHTEQMVGLRVILTRFLAQALSDQGVLCYWGTIKDDTVVVMKQHQSYGEAIIIDIDKKVAFSNGGEMRFSSSVKILRKDKEVKTASAMNREETISFLSVSSCLLSFTGITQSMKRAIYNLSSCSTASYAVSESVVNL